MEKKHMLRCHRLSKANILHDLSFTVEARSAVAIIGPSGAGKSTLLRCINGLTAFDEGECWIDHQPVSVKKTRSSAQGPALKSRFIFQQLHLSQQSTVYENIALALFFQNGRACLSTSQKNHVDRLLEQTGLGPYKNRKVRSLSGGQQQRVAIARALAPQAPLLLCDEPTSALDLETASSMAQLLKQLQTEYAFTMMVVSHDLDIIKIFCDHVLFLEQGRLLAYEKIIPFFNQPPCALAQQWVYSSFGVDVPPNLLWNQDYSTQALWRLHYIDTSAKCPLISIVLEKFPVQVNILRANIEDIQGHTLGILLIIMSGDRIAQRAAQQFLEEQSVMVETLGYVH